MQMVLLKTVFQQVINHIAVTNIWQSHSCIQSYNHAIQCNAIIQYNAMQSYNTDAIMQYNYAIHCNQAIHCNHVITLIRTNSQHQKLKGYQYIMSEIGAVVKVVDSHLCDWGSIPGKSCSFLIISLCKGLSLCFMCSGQHVHASWTPLTSSLLLDYHVKQYIHTPIDNHYNASVVAKS